MGRSETDLCSTVGDQTFYTEHRQRGKLVPEEKVDWQHSTENQIVPDLNMSVSLSHPTFSLSCQEQLTVIEPRRTSYQEIVHNDSILQANGRPALTRLVTTLTEWLVILQGVAEDRECDRPSARCRCYRASRIQAELRGLQTRLVNAEQICERVGRIGDEDVNDIHEQLHKIALMLRSEVSILIPTSIGRADPMVVEQARWLAQDTDSRNCASEAVEGVSSLVLRLLGVESCTACTQPQGSPQVTPLEGGYVDGGGVDGSGDGSGDVDMDILNLVAGMCNGYPDGAANNNKELENPHLQEIGRQVFEKSRKRKQTRPVRIPSPNIHRKARKIDPPSPAVSEDTNILCLLEKKKKGVKKDGLYKFVLWREALKDEKAKVVEPGAASRDRLYS